MPDPKLFPSWLLRDLFLHPDSVQGYKCAYVGDFVATGVNEQTAAQLVLKETKSGRYYCSYVINTGDGYLYAEECQKVTPQQVTITTWVPVQ